MFYSSFVFLITVNRYILNVQAQCSRSQIYEGLSVIHTLIHTLTYAHSQVQKHTWLVVEEKKGGVCECGTYICLRFGR